MSGGSKFPPQVFHMLTHLEPSHSNIDRSNCPTGTFPTRRSTARAGHLVWRLFGASGLISSWRARVLNPEMIVSPGQRTPREVKLSLAHSSSLTKSRARSALIAHRLCRPHTSRPTGLCSPLDDIRPHADGEQAQHEDRVEGGDPIGDSAGGEGRPAGHPHTQFDELLTLLGEPKPFRVETVK